MKYKSTSRRGILLLLILALLAMFGMVAVAFVMLSSQTLSSSKVSQRHEQAYYPPPNDLDEAAMQLFRGTVNPLSKMGHDSFLEDMYGSATLVGQTVQEPTNSDPIRYHNVCGGQLVEIFTNIAPAVMERYIGSVLTVTTSPNPSINGLSTRIVGTNTKYGLYWIDPTTGNREQPIPLHSYIQIVAFPNGVVPPVGTNFIINGMPFSGTGVGANPLTGKIDLRYTFNTNTLRYELSPIASLPAFPPNLDPYSSRPVAFLPFLPLSTYTNLLTNPNGIPFPQVNKDYTAADYQTMFLATPPIPIGPYNRILPSMHRPALVNYWYQQLFNDYVLSGIDASADPTKRWMTIFKPVEAYKAGFIKPPPSPLPPRWRQAPTREQIVSYILELKRNIIGRPLTDDHPAFNGSNPTSLSSYVYHNSGAGTYTPFSWECGDIFTQASADNQPHWDVDTDGDGIPDANWIDIGLPVRSTPDGRKYKTLVAYYVLDLDGRLNLNAHGNLAQTIPAYNTQQNPAIIPDPLPAGFEFPAACFAGGVQPQLKRGRGFGPADINLAAILPMPPASAINFYQQVLSGNAAAGIEGRYGADGVPGDCAPIGKPKLFSSLDPAIFEQRKYNDYLSANKWFEFDGLRDSVSSSLNANSAASVGSLPGFTVNSEHPDPSSKDFWGVDPAGRPVVQGMNLVSTYNLPYELNLSPQTHHGLPTTSGASNPPDNPFSVNELERILRPFDRDIQSQASRLAALTNIPGTNKSLLNYDLATLGRNFHEHDITSESWDVPVYNAGLPAYLIKQVQDDLATAAIPTPNPLPRVPDWYKPTKVTDLLKAYVYYQLRKVSALVPLDPTDDPLNPTKSASLIADKLVNDLTPQQLLSLFPPEMLAGLKMNINHPFAGPIDIANNRNYNLAVLWQNSGMDNTYGKIWFGQMPDFPDGSSLPTVPFASRQLYARYLYVLALLLSDPNSDAQWFDQTKTPATERPELTRRRIAQWAINTASFKVNDSIMVPFEYDEEPLFNPTTNSINGWRVDGIIGTPSNPSPDDSQTFRGLVWGAKPPEAILTESLAFHNLHIADTAFETTQKKTDDSQNPDTDYDQTRVPQGSAFFEIYCTRDMHGSTPPSDLYVYNPNTKKWYLNLGKMAPPAQGANFQYPVWRMVIGESAKSSADNDIQKRVLDHPDSVSLEPEQYRGGPSDRFSLLRNPPAGEHNVAIDRIVWFCSQAPITNGSNPGVDMQYDSKRVYWNFENMQTLLDCGNYAIIGPRKVTRLSLTNEKNVDTECALGKLGKQMITMPTPGGSPYYSRISDGQADPNIAVGKIKMPIGIIAAGMPLAWTSTNVTAPHGVGINISEPLLDAYYPEPNTTIDPPSSWPADEKIKEWYGDPKMLDPSKYFREHPLDSEMGPLAADGLVTQVAPVLDFTYLNYKTVFLQRLANPSAPYDPLLNPYRTVDWMPIDLTVYTGEDKNKSDIAPNSPTQLLFATRQRGNSSLPNNDPNYFNIWNPLLTDSPDKASYVIKTDVPTNANFKRELTHSLGYLNRAFWFPNPTNPSTTTPWINNDPSLTPTRPTELYGDSLVKPFPWMPWFARPYVSELELMMVPTSTTARMLMEFRPGMDSGRVNHYAPTAANIAIQPFPQLLNFLQSQKTDSTNPMNQFHRILDYVSVPSWYAGTEIQANPTLAFDDTINPTTGNQHWFHTPYNRISTYREPGKINLNTIFSPEVFSGLMNGRTAPTWAHFVQSRRGYGTGGNMLDQNPFVPTEFLAPFRNYDATTLSAVMGNQWKSGTLPNEIQATWLRENSANPGNPLFQQDPLTNIASRNPVENTNRNPYFHYSDLMRMGNLTTNRSNVFAVWITVGYFEVTPIPTNWPNISHPWLNPVGLMMNQAQFQQLLQQIYPDGFEFGQELGSDTGEVVRHRAFYIFDRSIPVGFQRGQDLNVEKAILLKRIIE